MCDEMRYPTVYESEELKEYRREYLKTQELLRRSGMEFHRHYAASVACVPSRASLYTGQYPSLHGVTQTTGAAKSAPDPSVFWLDPNNVPTMGEYFRTGGYRTFWHGKWHASDADLLTPGTHNPITSYDDQTGVPDPKKVAQYRVTDRLTRTVLPAGSGLSRMGRARSTAVPRRPMARRDATRVSPGRHRS